MNVYIHKHIVVPYSNAIFFSSNKNQLYQISICKLDYGIKNAS